MRKKISLLGGAVIFCICLTAFFKNQETSIVYIDDVETEVYFNDGDTFKIIDGKFAGKRVRLTGFNALENYGPVHSWQNTTKKYLYKISNQATSHAQNGTWNCEYLEEKDGYGRLLMQCDDLAESLIYNGLAHAYTIDESPALESYLVAQRHAQENKLAMWKYGVPEYIVTSVHSEKKLENPQGVSPERLNYNRLISTLDGHSEKWYHNDEYKTCEEVCLDDNSCMTYVPFNNRYGKYRAECLL